MLSYRERGIFMKKSVKTIIAVALLLVLLIGAALAWKTLGPKAVSGAKTVTVTVIHGDKSEKVFEIKTDSETLGEPLKSQGIISGTESEYGLFITTVDGETADDSLQQWWCLTKAGEMSMYGVDETVIADGECYELTLTTGW